MGFWSGFGRGGAKNWRGTGRGSRGVQWAGLSQEGKKKEKFKNKNIGRNWEGGSIGVGGVDWQNKLNWRDSRGI